MLIRVVSAVIAEVLLVLRILTFWRCAPQAISLAIVLCVFSERLRLSFCRDEVVDRLLAVLVECLRSLLLFSLKLPFRPLLILVVWILLPECLVLSSCFLGVLGTFGSLPCTITSSFFPIPSPAVLPLYGRSCCFLLLLGIVIVQTLRSIMGQPLFCAFRG